MCSWVALSVLRCPVAMGKKGALSLLVEFKGIGTLTKTKVKQNWHHWATGNRSVFREPIHRPTERLPGSARCGSQASRLPARGFLGSGVLGHPEPNFHLESS